MVILVFWSSPQKLSLVEDIEFFLTLKICKFHSARGLRGEVENVSDLCSHLGFLSSPQNKNFEEDIRFLLPVKFCQIAFSGLSKEVINVKS